MLNKLKKVLKTEEKKEKKEEKKKEKKEEVVKKGFDPDLPENKQREYR